MKQGINQVIPVEIDFDFERIKSIQFKFKQGVSSLIIPYPSENAVRREEENIIDIMLTPADTYRFAPSPVELDTFIQLTDSDINPQTEIVTINLKKTLFKHSEVNSFE